MTGKKRVTSKKNLRLRGHSKWSVTVFQACADFKESKYKSEGVFEREVCFGVKMDALMSFIKDKYP